MTLYFYLRKTSMTPGLQVRKSQHPAIAIGDSHVESSAYTTLNTEMCKKIIYIHICWPSWLQQKLYSAWS